MSQFKRENRYFVAKVKDVKQALNSNQMAVFMNLHNRVNQYRSEQGKQPLECVVVESGWPIYESVWNEIKKLSKENLMVNFGPYTAIEKVNLDAAQRDIKETLNEYQSLVHGCMVELGWWKDSKTGIDLVQCIRDPKLDLDIFIGKSVVATKLCLVHSEISEAMEGARKDLMDDKLQHRKMVEVELADAMIRIMDLSGAMGLDLGGAVAEKLAYNTQRADHKVENREKAGGKAF